LENAVHLRTLAHGSVGTEVFLGVAVGIVATAVNGQRVPAAVGILENGPERWVSRARKGLEVRGRACGRRPKARSAEGCRLDSSSMVGLGLIAMPRQRVAVDGRQEFD
jgi:hypothetical protein